MDQSPSDPVTDQGQMSPAGPTPNKGWQRAVLAALALFAVALVVALLVLPLSIFQQPQTAEAVKHPPYQPGKACNAANCHEFTHKQPYNNRPCDACHILESWTYVTFTHPDAQMNAGIHPVLGCSECHTYGTPPPSAACQGCHKSKSPHHQPAYTNCANCHQAIGWKFVKIPPGHLSLAGGHAGLECTSCHNPVSFKAPGRDCSNCHGPMHGYTKGCARCHDPARFWTVPPGAINHSFFPFGVAHRNIACRVCHPALRFVGTNPECTACHGVNHGFNGDCTRCHSVFIGGWKTKHFNHGFYPLSGVHAAFDCGACHPKRVQRGLKNPRKPSKLLPPSNQLQFVGANPTCFKCHGTPHGSCLSTNCFQCHNTASWQQVDFNHRDVWQYYSGAHTKLDCSACHPGGIKFCSFKGTQCQDCHGKHHGLSSGCTRCHNTTAWQDVNFDHSFWRYYTGAHRHVACQSCHANLNFANPPSPICSNCHGAPHGQCLNNQGVGCVVCHNTSSWDDVDFNHRDYWSDYTGAHTELACSRCHPNGLVFCDVKGTKCIQCHGEQHGFTSNVCPTCHTTTAFWPLKSSWEHVIPLGGFHRQSSRGCFRCHPGTNFVNPPRTCQTCHPTPPHGLDSNVQSCIKCHWPTSWTDLHFSHADPDQVTSYGAKVYGIHSDLGIMDTCSNCHPGGNFTEAEVKCTPCHAYPPPVN